jgi:hypothetical protein
MAIFVVKKRELKPNRKLFPDHFPFILDGALQLFFFKIIFHTSAKNGNISDEYSPNFAKFLEDNNF